MKNYDKYFTETNNGLDIEANNIDVNCITSQNNKFSLDSEGNLIVNSVTSSVPVSGTIDRDEILDMIYPVGSFYITASNTNPGTLFKGTWEKIENKFLLASGSSYVNGTTGGTTEHSHTMGAHTHGLGDEGFACIDMSTQYINQRELSSGVSYTQNFRKTVSGSAVDKTEVRPYGTALGGRTQGMSSSVNTGATTVLPPYLAVNVWKRTA